VTRPRIIAAAALGLVLLASPWWGRRALRALAYFHVRSVQVIGAHYLQPRDVVVAMRVDTMASTWDDLRPYAARVNALALVQHAEVERELPGTLIVRIEETTPVAMAPTPAGGLRVYDSRARALPIDPTRADVDVPIIGRPDVVLTKLLAGVASASPRMFAEISAVDRSSASEIVLRLDRGTVRAGVDVTPERLARAELVASDLQRRGIAYTELDLRYRDQIVARVQ
jgi:cell division septal protein FtsQ